jgi:hypothetical protein
MMEPARYTVMKIPSFGMKEDYSTWRTFCLSLRAWSVPRWRLRGSSVFFSGSLKEHIWSIRDLALWEPVRDLSMDRRGWRPGINGSEE